MLSREQFVRDLRRALNHLYDPDHLLHSSLADLFGVADRFDAPIALQQILLNAISALEPAAGEPLDSRHWLVYGPLYHCYVQRLSRQQAAHQLGLSVRQMNRRQRIALETLTDRLWEQFRLKAATGEALADERDTSERVPMSKELAWLEHRPPAAPVDLRETLMAVKNQAQALADRYGNRLEVDAPGDLPRLTLQPLALKQALLSLISVAVRRAPGNAITISAKPWAGQVEVAIRVSAPGDTIEDSSDDDRASLDMAGYLADLCGGELDLTQDEPGTVGRLMLPTHDRARVLVIDDNVDTLQLLRRYALNTRYTIVAAENPEQALPLAAQLCPDIIVLDVMMPGLDGWELLASLQQHPLTSHIPIVVCTILREKELALSLGARGFVSKPVTRQAFLAALDRQLELMASESR